MTSPGVSQATHPSRINALVLAAGEGLLMLPWWYGIDALAHLRLSVTAFLTIWLGGWMLPRLITAWWRPARHGAAGLTSRVFEWIVPAAVLWVLHARLQRPMTAPEVAYALVSSGLWIEIWRFSLARVVAAGTDAVTESLRRLMVIGGCLWPVSGYLSRLLVGGTDAKWYAYMLADFTTQSRAGIFPVFVGQSEWAWSGPIHPFRSAPLFLWAGGALDWLTARGLAPFSLQHLVALAATLTGGFTLYAVTCRLAPGRRWEGAGLAVIYASCPGLVQSIASADAFMTYTAIAVLPLVLYGNLRTLSSPSDLGGYGALAAGLSLVWMAHPPVAYYASFATLVLQTGILLFGSDPRRRLRSMAAGAAIWAVLSVYYFYGMSETGVSRPMTRDACLVVALAAAWRGVRALIEGERRLAAVLLPISGWLLWWIEPAWGWWWVGFVPLGTALGWAVRRGRSPEHQHHGFEGIWLGFLLAMLPATWALGPALPGHNAPALSLIREYGKQWVGFLAPLSPTAQTVTDWQPGLSLLLLGGIGVALAVRSGTLGAKLVAGMAIIACLVLIRVPVLSDFLVGYALEGLLQVGSLPLMLRTSPVIACLLAGVVVMGLATVRGRRARLVLGAAVAVGAVWSALEARRVVALQHQQTLPARSSEWALHSENAVLYRFVYDLLPIPAYYSEGKIDERLEQRILDRHRRLRFGPDDAARLSETGGAEQIVLTSRPDPRDPEKWLKIEPEITIPPGERRLLRFDFEPGTYAGQLLFFGNLGSYREYLLPVSGGPLAFGTGPSASRVISIWNTDIAPETYRLSFLRSPGHTVGLAGERFANLTISLPDPARLPIRIEGWLPYRAKVTFEEAGYLESSRAFFPGYEAKVDHRPVGISPSPQNLVMVPVPAGSHDVEIRFVGTWPLWLGAFVSATAWLALAIGTGLRATEFGRNWLAHRRDDLRHLVSDQVQAWQRTIGAAGVESPGWRRLGWGVVGFATVLRIALTLFPLQDPWWGAASWPAALYLVASALVVFLTWRLMAMIAASERTACLGVILVATASEFLFYSRLRLPFDWSFALMLGAVMAAVSSRSVRSLWLSGALAAGAAAIYEGYAWTSAVLVATAIMHRTAPREATPHRLVRDCVIGLMPIAVVVVLQKLGWLALSPWSPVAVPAWPWDLHLQFLRLSEGPLPLLWLGGMSLAVASALGRTGPRWLGRWSVATGIVGLGIFLLTAVFPIHASQGDVVRPLVWLACLLAAWSLDGLWRRSRIGMAATVLVVVAAGASAGPRFARLFLNVSHEQFVRLASEKVASLRLQGNSGIFHIELQSRGSGSDQSPDPDGLTLEAETVAPQPPYWQVLRLVKTNTGQNAGTFPAASLPEPWPGAVRLTVQLPAVSAKPSEPLITTGVTGRGDFLYLRRDPDQTVRLGFDHWGVAGRVSGPLAVDVAKPITVEASLGSLYPADAPAIRRSRLLVRVNGEIVWNEPAEFYAAPLGTVRFGSNPIGGSTTTEIFSGDFLEMHFLAPDELREFFAAP